MDTISLESINLGIVCPMANERSTASTFVNQVLVQCAKYKFRSIKFFVIFDDKCNDGTFTFLKKIFVLVNEVEIVYAPDNKCVVDAYKKGYTKALNSNCDWILEIDAGFSHQPSDIPIFFLKMLKIYPQNCYPRGSRHVQYQALYV